MSDVAASGTPDGFWIALPKGWVSLDVDPSTSAVSIRRLLASAAKGDETIAANRADLERVLIDAAREAAAAGVRYCAAYYELFADMPVQASLTIAIHAAAEGTDFGRMLVELRDADGARTLDIVDVDGRRAVRRSGHRTMRFPGSEEAVELLTRQFFIPVPNTSDLLAVAAFSTPTLSLEHEMTALFDTIAESFAFT